MNRINVFFVIGALLSIMLFGCTNKQDKSSNKNTSLTAKEKRPFFKLSLAQWSLHRAIGNGGMNPLDFAQIANELGFEGIEYVNTLYAEELKKETDANLAMQTLLEKLKKKSELYKVRNVLIMIDNEGALAALDEAQREAAVNNHKKWIDAAAFLGCHSIRVNLNGSTEVNDWILSSVDALKKLSTYAQAKNINVIVENHGGFSSNAELLSKVITTVNMKNCGTLPDFGNFCIKSLDDICVEEYDKYKGTEILMRQAKSVSAKSLDFDKKGNETTMDYVKLLQIIKNAGYTGYIGVEFSGTNMPEKEGIIATKNLLLTAAEKLN